jgi:hypothetical protein
VKDEAIDWMVYHLIAQEEGTCTETLAEKTGLEGDAIAASLGRLDRALLIERTGNQLRVLSVGEALLKCQAKYDTTLPYTIENGVVKARKTKDHDG